MKNSGHLRCWPLAHALRSDQFASVVCWFLSQPLCFKILSNIIDQSYESIIVLRDFSVIDILKWDPYTQMTIGYDRPWFFNWYEVNFNIWLIVIF